jgi:uncharacterized protein (DUF58 family)
MRFFQRIIQWLETRWVAPAYGGWLIGGLSLFFFVAATNTMAGWLYVISGVMFALLAIAAILPARSLRDIQIQRQPIQPVTAGDLLTITIDLVNQVAQPKTLIQVQDMLPIVLSSPRRHAIEVIASHQSYCWTYTEPTVRRGIFRWHKVELRSAAPLGLFWCRRSHRVEGKAIVYPTVLPLSQCPLIDEIGQRVNAQVQNSFNPYGATEGLTRTLRPYRWGDPTRLVHWRTSARYGELRVRELEVFTGGQEIVICLDSAASWHPEDFEQAVIAAASLYFYALQHQLQVSLWTAATGLVRGEQSVLMTLAATIAAETPQSENRLPDLPLLWLTQNSQSLSTLPTDSRWLLWFDGEKTAAVGAIASMGLTIAPNQDLQLQLQAPLLR